MSGSYIKRLLPNALAGVALCAAYAPFSWFVIAPPLIAIVLFAWSRESTRGALAGGWVFGFAYFCASCHWIYFSVHEYGHAPAIFALLVVVLLAAVLALYFAGLAYCVRYMASMPFMLRAIVWPSLWSAAEWLRGSAVSSFPWNLLGQTLVDSPLSGLLPVFGVYGSGWLLVLIGVLLFECVRRRRWSLSIPPVLIVLSGVLLAQVQWTQEKGEPVPAALLQANVPQTVRFNKQYIRSAIREYADMTRQAPDRALVIWPEAAVPLLYDRLEQSLLHPLVGELAERGGHLLGGFFVREEKRVYNSLVYFDGTRQFYHKRHLVPFGEYMPGRFLLNWIRYWVHIPMSDLSAGDLPPILDIGEHSVGVAICYEAAFTELVSDTMPEANYFIHLSNDAWFGDSSAARQHLQIARMRALEFARPVLRVTTTGISAIIDHRGRILKQSRQHSKEALIGRIQPRHGLTPYAMWRHWPVMPVLIFTLIIFGYYYRKQRK